MVVGLYLNINRFHKATKAGNKQWGKPGGAGSD